GRSATATTRVLPRRSPAGYGRACRPPQPGQAIGTTGERGARQVTLAAPTWQGQPGPKPGGPDRRGCPREREGPHAPGAPSPSGAQLQPNARGSGAGAGSPPELQQGP